eukprot:TRINITY_DN57887_c0_g1_i1.p1 TRINITY_DN57887_c0_g1~~TRINITY_DN57887_c0_g1_i1.p1  ORF type:complete len:144 (-),score=3.91 TRINITY_DN57887_c0_g1_i1:114-545(-)
MEFKEFARYWVLALGLFDLISGIICEAVILLYGKRVVVMIVGFVFCMAGILGIIGAILKNTCVQGFALFFYLLLFFSGAIAQIFIYNVPIFGMEFILYMIFSLMCIFCYFFLCCSKSSESISSLGYAKVSSYNTYEIRDYLQF